MKPTGADWGVTLAVGAVLVGILAEIADVHLLTVVAFVLLFVALGAIASDTVSANSVLAVAAFCVVLAGCGATIAGFAIGSDVLTFGGLTVVVVATVVTIGELWGTT